ncbi:MAG: TIGR04255 family protein [Candidatus Muiribacteriota bacterium]
MSDKIPVKLNKNPIIDVLFECRLDVAFPISNILPGFFYSHFDCKKNIEKLPHSDIPEAIRKHDPNLKYLPLVRMRIDGYSFLIGDSSISVSCDLPYRGWGDFKKTITEMISVLKKSDIVNGIDRYSLKYVDLIQSKDVAEQVNLANIYLRIGEHELTNEPYQIRMDTKVDGFINIIQIISGAKVKKSTQERPLEGVVFDIDTIKPTNGMSLEKMEENIEESLDSIHSICKKTFFDCITKETLNKLEPEYDD